MRIHRYLASALAAAAIATAGASSARAQCNTAGYNSVTENFPTPQDIPDADPLGIVLGPFATAADGQFFTDVIFGLKLNHTYVGDLVIDVTYDLTCDGSPEYSSRLVCRPLSEGTCISGETVTFGCGANAQCANNYMFSDAGTEEMGGTPASCNLVTGIVPSGCYRPSPIADLPLSVFDGKPKGGCFRMQVADHAAVDVGSVCQWSLFYTAEGPVPTAGTTWGQLKTRYR